MTNGCSHHHSFVIIFWSMVADIRYIFDEVGYLSHSKVLRHTFFNRHVSLKTSLLSDHLFSLSSLWENILKIFRSRPASLIHFSEFSNSELIKDMKASLTNKLFRFMHLKDKNKTQIQQKCND